MYINEEPRNTAYIGEGWFPLVRALESYLDRAVGANNWTSLQIKEKFGGLRFYVRLANDDDVASTIADEYDMAREDALETAVARKKAVRNAIEAIESMSFVVCELCGRPGRPRTDNYWVRTLCFDCWGREEEK